MVTVILRLMATFSSEVGLTQIAYSKVDTLGNVINQFLSDHGKKIRKSFINQQGTFKDHVVILVNGRNYLFLDGLKTKLKDGDDIVISPPLVGG